MYEIPESTSRFTPGSREVARRALGLSGDPLLLWVGHLNENKDPLTVLAGVSEAARELPDLELWCCFGTAPLLRHVQRRVQADPALRGRVHLLGRVPHERVEQLMRAADAFVLGSHREGSGYSLIEALACGLPPVVTNIPSFRALTGAGAVGMLWEPGNPRSLCAALLALRARADAGPRMGVRAHFDPSCPSAPWAASSEPPTKVWWREIGRRQCGRMSLVSDIWSILGRRRSGRSSRRRSFRC